jgi:hypothetical protein
VRYRGIEYVIRNRSENEWEWEISVPFGPKKTGLARGSRTWARTVAARAIDVWLLMNPAALSELPAHVMASSDHVMASSDRVMTPAE